MAAILFRLQRVYGIVLKSYTYISHNDDNDNNDTAAATSAAADDDN